MTLVEQTFEKYDWGRLNHLQVGRYAEYFVKMEFTLYGFEVYTSEVDDRGIDFVVRSKSARFYEIQAKSIRGLNYVFFPKDKFQLRDSLLAALVIFMPREAPQLFLIPSLSWKDTDSLLVDRPYVGLKSKPEWGLNLSVRNLQYLEPFHFQKIVRTL